MTDLLLDDLILTELSPTPAAAPVPVADDAVAHHTREVAALEARAASPEQRVALAAAYSNLGQSLAMTGAWDAAVAPLGRAAGLRDRLVAAGMADAAVAVRGRADLATLHVARGDLTGARSAIGAAPPVAMAALPASLVAALAELEATAGVRVASPAHHAAAMPASTQAPTQAPNEAPDRMPDGAPRATPLDPLALEPALHVGDAAHDVPPAVDADASDPVARPRIAAIDAAMALATPDAPSTRSRFGAVGGLLRRIARR